MPSSICGRSSPVSEAENRELKSSRKAPAALFLEERWRNGLVCNNNGGLCGRIAANGDWFRGGNCIDAGTASFFQYDRGTCAVIGDLYDLGCFSGITVPRCFSSAVDFASQHALCRSEYSGNPQFCGAGTTGTLSGVRGISGTAFSLWFVFEYSFFHGGRNGIHGGVLVVFWCLRGLI